MNPNYRTLNNDIGMIQRTNNGWDLWFDNGDLVKAEDFHSLQVGIIIACLTSWNYMNRYGNPTYEVFGNRAYQLLKANKGSMVQYKIQQFFMECLKRMRRVYDVVRLEVFEVPYEPHKYYVEFEVISINNELVDGSFTITTDTNKSSSYIEYTTYMPYASKENDLIIDLYLKNEYGGGLEGEILYMYLKRGDDDYEFRGVVGQTDENGYLRVTYNPWDDETDETRHSDDVNVIYFDFHGNTTYNPTTSKRTQFKTELFNYHIEFLEQNIVVVNEYADLRIRLTKESTTDYKIYPMGYTTVTVIGTDGRIYDATTDANGEVAIRVDISEDTLFTTSYNGSSDGASVSIFKQTPIIDFTTSKSELFVNDALMLRAIVKDESNNPINGMDVTFEMDDGIIGTSTTDNDGVAILSLNDLTIGTHDFIASVGDTFLYDSVESDVETVIAKKHSPSISLSVKDSLLLERTDTAFEAMVTENGGGLYGVDVEFIFTDGDYPEIILWSETVQTDNGVATLTTSHLDARPYRVFARIVETDIYESDEDYIDVEVQPHDYSLEITGAIVGIYNGEYTVQVSVALYDHDVLSNGVLYGEDEEDMLVIECNETGDVWKMGTSDSSQVFETEYTIYEGDDTTALTFTATWDDLSSSLSLELIKPSTKILATFMIFFQQGRKIVQQGRKIVGYLCDMYDQPLSLEYIRYTYTSRNQLYEHYLRTEEDGHFEIDAYSDYYEFFYDGNYIYSASYKAIDLNDEETWDDF